MAAVAAGSAQVQDVLVAAGLDGRVVLANHNGPRQTVVSGPTADVEAAVSALRSAGLGAKRIAVACAFHSPVVAAAGALFAAELSTVDVREPQIPVWANRTARRYGDDVRGELAAQIGSPVRFADQIEDMYAAGARIFVEAGPGRVLSRLVDDILGDRPHRAIACEPRPGLRGFLEALAALAVAGVPVQTHRLFAGRDAVDVTGVDPPKPASWTVNGHLVRTLDGATVPGGLAPARILPEAIMNGTPPAPAPRPDPDALVAEFLRIGRDMVAAQRDVLLAYLGAAPVAPTRPIEYVAAPAPVAAVSTPAVADGLAALVPAPTAAAVPAPAQAPPVPMDVGGTVLQVISERTGYPADMIELDLDLEADLSIDSIKRTEIAGELAVRLGLGGDAGRLADAEVEDLVKARTARAIADWLTARLTPVPTPATDPTTATGTIVEVGTVTAHAQPGNDRPRLFGTTATDATATDTTAATPTGATPTGG
jgi:malonyl CoA-acyl carrier protein transacylase